jgi:hypothetical protein
MCKVLFETPCTMLLSLLWYSERLYSPQSFRICQCHSNCTCLCIRLRCSCTNSITWLAWRKKSLHMSHRGALNIQCKSASNCGTWMEMKCISHVSISANTHLFPLQGEQTQFLYPSDLFWRQTNLPAASTIRYSIISLLSITSLQV